MDRVVLSWNVAGLSEASLDERTEAQCLTLLLSEPSPHVIALQEVVRRTWYAHWRPHLAAAGFRVFPADPTETDSAYFSLLAVRGASAEAVSVPFAPSRMGRRLVGARWDGWTFLTAHLESERGGGRARVDQATAIAAHLLACPGPAVFAGDTNLRIEEEPRVAGLAELTDAWTATGALPSTRATWRGGRASARFDRVWVNAAAQVDSFELLAAGASLSDHAPVRVRLRLPH
jgi:endonuclease/exonuclease/phosphatase family metal-dependent hydrolase